MAKGGLAVGIKTWLRKQMALNAKRKRETAHHFDRQQVIQKKIQRVWSAELDLGKVNKMLDPILRGLPDELKSAKPDLERINKCVTLLNSRIGSRGRMVSEIEKALRTARKIDYPMPSIEAFKKATEELIETDQLILECIQRWKKKTGQE